MTRQEAYEIMVTDVLPSVKGTKWEEPMKLATDALEESLPECEACKVVSVDDT